MQNLKTNKKQTKTKDLSMNETSLCSPQDFENHSLTSARPAVHIVLV